jgi:hypothetical protein
MVSNDSIVALALCSCGHGIARHDEHGCPGAMATFCMCRLTPSAALDAAIERVHEANRAGRRAARASRVHRGARTMRMRGLHAAR